MESTGDFSAYLQNLQREKLSEMTACQAAQIGFSDEPLVLSSAEQLQFSNIGYEFTGWNTEPDGTGASYRPGDPLSVQSDVVLYAQWKQTKRAAKLKPQGIVDSVPGYQDRVKTGSSSSSLRMPFTVDFDEDHDLSVCWRTKLPSWLESATLFQIADASLDGQLSTRFAIDVSASTSLNTVAARRAGGSASDVAALPEDFHPVGQWLTVSLAKTGSKLYLQLTPDNGSSFSSEYRLSSSFPQLLVFGGDQIAEKTATTTVQQLSTVRELVPAQAGVWKRKQYCTFYPKESNSVTDSGKYGYSVSVEYQNRSSMQTSHHVGQPNCGYWDPAPTASHYAYVKRLVDVEQQETVYERFAGCQGAEFDFGADGCGLTANGVAYYLKASVNG